MEPLYTPNEVAENLQVGYRTILNAIHLGALKAYRIGGQFRISEQAITEYLQNAKVKSIWKNDRNNF